jgi:hypothetical protein
MESSLRGAVKWSRASPTEEDPMLLVIVIAAITGLIGFAALMGYMFYLTPGPHDRL